MSNSEKEEMGNYTRINNQKICQHTDTGVFCKKIKKYTYDTEKKIAIGVGSTGGALITTVMLVKLVKKFF